MLLLETSDSEQPLSHDSRLKPPWMSHKEGLVQTRRTRPTLSHGAMKELFDPGDERGRTEPKHDGTPRLEGRVPSATPGVVTVGAFGSYDDRIGCHSFHHERMNVAHGRFRHSRTHRSAPGSILASTCASTHHEEQALR